MIRKAKASEIEEIMAITRACALKMNSENIYQWNEVYPNREAFIQDLDREELYVMIHQEQVIGCLTVSSNKDEEYDPIAWLTEDGLQFYIHRLAIHPNFQHQGNAKHFMDFAEAYAREHQAVSVRLDTFSKNTRNQRFYEARGFLRIPGEINFPKQTPHPFYCYELILK